MEEFLIQWEGIPSPEASWMDKEKFQVQFPDTNLEDKICLDEVGNVTSSTNADESGPASTNGPSNKPKRVIKKPKRFED
ncbi:hypothetical protein A2U01_0044179 [Trifolium medium]|uniref:Chromo domain-containing protein n=1 Tax=Trifolium medium TaxID=97028 RepID=A0A392QF52_9FABA|nr:hypothetical protein [Trifolium medium]